MYWNALPYFFLIGAGLCLMGYSVIRFRIYLREMDNPVAYHLPLAMALSGLGVFIFGVFSIAPNPASRVYLLLGAAPFLQLFGYAHFIAIPAYIFLKRRGYILTKGLLYIFSCLLIIDSMSLQPVIGGFNDIALGLSIMEEAALLSNTLLLIRNYRGKKLSFNIAGLVIAYLFAAPSGTYFYFGTDPLLLGASGLGLLVGVAILLSSAIVQLKKETPTKETLASTPSAAPVQTSSV